MTIAGREAVIESSWNVFDETVWRIREAPKHKQVSLLAILDHQGQWREIGDIGAGTMTDWPSREAAQAVIDKFADKPTPAEPPADAGKMVAVGEGRELPDKPGIWFRVGSDQAWLVQQDNDGSLCARAINVANLREPIGLHNDVHFQLSRGNWHPTTAETERLRGEVERLRFESQCAEERVQRRGFINVGSPTALYEHALQNAETQLAAAERERDAAKARLTKVVGLCDSTAAWDHIASVIESRFTRLQAELAAEIPDSLVGWTITAAFADGSFRVQSPIGEVKRVTFFRDAASAKGGA